MDKSKFTVKNVTQFLEDNAITVVLFLMVAYVGFTKDNFFSFGTLVNLASNTSVRFLVALGVSGCLITKGTDLSAGRVVGFGACIAAALLQQPDYANKYLPWLEEYPLVAVIILTLAVCAVIGLVNGIIIAYFHVPPFIATLGMQTLVYGVCLVFTKSQPIGALQNKYTHMAQGNIPLPGGYNIPYLMIYAVIIGAIIWFIYNKTRHGKYMYAIGGNENAAEVSGVNTRFAKIRIYTTAAILYGFAGVLLGAKSGGASVGLGAGWELEAIAACTIGGVSTNGGVGRVSGILLGVLVFELLKLSLQFLGVNTSYQYIVQGIVIIVAVALDIRKYVAKK